MSFWSDMDYEMQPLPLDSDTADRLLAGRVAPQDAPPGYGPVVRLLEAASAEASAEELEQGIEAVPAIATVVRSSRHAGSGSLRRVSMPFALTRVRLAAAAFAAAFASTAGLASAGSLPGAAQDVASNMLAKVGISVPGPNDHAGTHPDVRGKSGDTTNAPASRENTGSEISEFARTTELTGVEKGAAISTAASDGKSQAGEHGSGSGAGGGNATGTTPNSGSASPGGQETAETASGGNAGGNGSNPGPPENTSGPPGNTPGPPDDTPGPPDPTPGPPDTTPGPPSNIPSGPGSNPGQ
jgi:hypothetical protein